MSSSSSLSYTRHDRTDPAFTIARQIVSARDPDNKEQLSPQGRPGPQPTIHLRAPSTNSSSTILGSRNPAYLNNDDLYSGLSTFSFGAADTSPHPASREGISPLTPGPPMLADRTPRPSVSASAAASSSSLASHLSARTIDNSDTASQHTFGGARYSIHTSTHPNEDLTSTRSSSRASSVQLQFSDSSPSEGEGDSSMEYGSPLTFTRGMHTGMTEGPPFEIGIATDGAADEMYYYEPGMGGPRRRESLPIHDPLTSGRDREDSLATLRRASRSLDDDLRQFNAARAAAAAAAAGTTDVGAEPMSEPVSRADWQTLEQQNQANEFDMSYITQGIGFSLAHESASSIITSPSSRRTSAAPSYVSPAAYAQAQAQAQRRRQSSGGGWGWGRRPSTATTSSTYEDAFLKHVRVFDAVYMERRNGWTFRREKADGGVGAGAVAAEGESAVGLTDGLPVAGTSAAGGGRKRVGMVPGTQEIWRCEYAGRFKVDSVQLASTDPAKAPQQRLNITHIIDPFSKGNKRGGPPIIVHRHSRAIAFSILRKRYPTSRQRGHHAPQGAGAGGAPGQHRIGIMLAPRKVQEQYTSTQTTSRLKSYGLLEDGPRERTESGVSREREKERRKREEEERKKREKERGKRMGGENGKGATTSGGTVASVESSGSTTSNSSNTADGSLHISTAPPKSAPVEHTYPPMSPALSATTTLGRHPSGQSRRTTFDTVKEASSVAEEAGPSSSSSSRRSLVHRRPRGTRNSSSYDSDDDESESEDVDDSDEDSDRPPPPSRTPHSETYASLDAARIAHLQTHGFGAFSSHPRSSPASGPTSFPKNLLSSITRSKSSTGTAPHHGHLAAAGSSKVPWMLTAPRLMQEESERQVQGVDRSFKSVGLLPTYDSGRKRGKGVGGLSRKKGEPSADPFKGVPEDSLYMLLPMWPGDSDMMPGATAPNTPLHDRQYLLVSYRPRETAKDGKKADAKDTSGGKKKQKSSPTSSGNSSHHGSGSTADSKTLVLSNFDVSARLLGYKDLCQSGVRLPDDGLCVTGGMDEAMQFLPPPHLQQHEVVIAVCPARERGIEFVPEGLAQVGLCMPQPAIPVVLNDGRPDAEMFEPEMQFILSPIGLSAVEMAWAGCMAVTSFGGVQ